MYTNIPTHTALNLIGKYHNQYQRKHNNEYPKDAVRAGLHLVMTMNIFTFGDLTLKQLKGTAMGTPQHRPTPQYITEFMKKNSFHTMPNEWSSIEDSSTTSSEYGAHITITNRTHRNGIISKKMNAFPGRTWEFSERAKTIDFMDMTISINNSNKIETTLFKKRLNLHLYIPPHSAHPPGLLPGIVCGTLFRIFTLCSDNEDKLQRTKFFLNASLPVATKEMKSGHYSTKPLRMQNHTVDQHKMRMTTTTASSSTYRSIQTIPHLPVSKQNGEHTSPNLNGNCPWNT